MSSYEDYAFIANYYDHVVPYRHRPDIPFYVEAAKESGGPVLELGCGTGRILIPTAQAGREIVGLDLSPHMLGICQENLAQEPGEVQRSVTIYQGDMRDFSLNQIFKLVTTPFRSFQHLLIVKDQVSCLQSIHKHLDEDGRLILEVFNTSLESLTKDNLGEEFGEEPEFVMPDGQRVVRSHRIMERDLFHQIIQVEIIYSITHPSGKQEQLIHAFPMRYFFHYEVQHLLERCGFELENVYADFDKSPYGSKYPGELIFVAKKR